jgi:hypothetical protein
MNFPEGVVVHQVFQAGESTLTHRLSFGYAGFHPLWSQNSPDNELGILCVVSMKRPKLKA